MNRRRVILCCLLLVAAPAIVQGADRSLSTAETDILVGSLFRASGDALAEDPSCKSDLSAPGVMTIGEGLAIRVANAMNAKKPVLMTASCFLRNGYKIESGEEYCKVSIRNVKKADFGGVLFKMDWKKKALVPGATECF